MLTKTLAIAFLVIALPAAAQEPSAPRVTARQTISTGAASSAIGNFNVEIQRRVAENVTIGVSGGRFDFDLSLFGSADEHDMLVTVIARYYPVNEALTGLFVGVRAGMHRDTHFTYTQDLGGCGFLCPGEITARRRETSPAAGIEIGYDWIVGGHGYFGIGAGAIRTTRRNGGSSELIPTIRLNMGIAF